jgi:two-component system sensor histidine kinase ChiS
MDSTSTDTTLLPQIAVLEQQLQQAQEEIAQLQNEKADLEMMLEMTTEHSDSLEEELYEKVEATLRDSEKRFRTIAETIPVPVIISHAETQTILYANAPVGRLVGMQTDEVIGCKLRKFSRNRDDLQQIYTILETQGQVSNYEMLGKTKEGLDFWVEVNVHAITFNDEPCILIAMYDITDRKRAEQERVQLTANLEQALNQQRTLTKAYSRFVPVEILKFLGKESIVDVQLGEHTRQEMTVLFSDIRSFTTLSEHMSPQENFNFINSYLSRVSPVIRKNNGFIDKYIGDAIMALFPGSNFPGQADDALQAAVEMQQEVTLYNTHRAKQGYQPIHIGVGLHTGSVMLGTVGEAERMEGTVISDAVNLASRLEGLTKLYNVSIVVSERTLFSLERVMKYRFRFLDKVLVKGKKEPVSVFEILEGLEPEVIERRLRTQTYFEKGLLHYHSKEFLAAKDQFQKVLDIDPTDHAAELYIQRVNYYIEYGVPVNWEGVEALTEK